MAMSRKLAVSLAAPVLSIVLSMVVAAPLSAEEVEPDLARGAELFQLCAQCHGPQGQGNKLFLAPSIAGLDRWYVEYALGKFRSGHRGRNFDDIAGMRMRPMSLTLAEDEVVPVAAYVAQLPKPDPASTVQGDAEAGKPLYQLCAACHGPDARGNPAQKAPPLVTLNDWYLVEQLMKFKMGIRGTAPGDPYGVLMGPNSPMALTLKTDESVRNVVAYIQTLRAQPAAQQTAQND